MPAAVAIIMDGNGRWAKARGLPRSRGHEAGAESVRAITRECARLGVRELTLYSFSTENWRRPPDEVAFLMQLLERYLVDERGEIMTNGIRFRTIGRTAELPAPVRARMDETIAMSAGNTGMVLRLALNYGGRQEILDAVARIAEDARAGSGSGPPAVLDQPALRRYLYEPEMLDPDLLIRTSGEMRISNFLLWQVSYAELYVTDVLWPDFREREIRAAFRAYAARDRRFGGTGE